MQAHSSLSRPAVHSSLLIVNCSNPWMIMDCRYSTQNRSRRNMAHRLNRNSRANISWHTADR